MMPRSFKASITSLILPCCRYLTPPCTSLVEREDVPLAKSYFSNNTVLYPRDAASTAIPSPEAPLKIAGRVRDTMKRFLDSRNPGVEFKTNLGVLLCDAEYANIEEILKDITLARKLLSEGLYTNPSIFDSEMLSRHQ